MRVIHSAQSKKSLAAEALRETLRQVSAIKLKGIDFDAPNRERRIDILAHIDVHGRSHMLVCTVNASDQAGHVRTALDDLQSHVAQIAGNATPVLIVPRISDGAQALCAQSKAGIVDLEGNARIDVDEVFIGIRSLPQLAVSGREAERLAGVA